MMAVSHLYLKAHLDIDDEETPLIEGLLDDIIDAHFGIVVVIVWALSSLFKNSYSQQKEKKLTDTEVDDWFREKADTELAA